MNIWIVWAQYYDRSNDPEFIAAFSDDRKANHLISMIMQTSPNMKVEKFEVWLTNAS